MVGFSVTPSTGRSPLTRGRLEQAHAAVLAAGSIPAHAGKTGGVCRVQRLRAVDPRSRGEDCSAPSWKSSVKGRSPLTRGRPRPQPRCKTWPRSIPAHAGKTRSAGAVDAVQRVDPRSRGEDIRRVRRRKHSWGRSPLTRGRRSDQVQDASGAGSIPAHAGKTHDGACGLPRGWVDPRSRGEDAAPCATTCTAPGRSPLTRGRP